MPVLLPAGARGIGASAVDRSDTACGLGAHASANLGSQARAEGVDLDRRTGRDAIVFAAGGEPLADGSGPEDGAVALEAAGEWQARASAQLP